MAMHRVPARAAAATADVPAASGGVCVAVWCRRLGDGGAGRRTTNPLSAPPTQPARRCRHLPRRWRGGSRRRRGGDGGGGGRPRRGGGGGRRRAGWWWTGGGGGWRRAPVVAGAWAVAAAVGRWAADGRGRQRCGRADAARARRVTPRSPSPIAAAAAATAAAATAAARPRRRMTAPAGSCRAVV